MLVISSGWILVYTITNIFGMPKDVLLLYIEDDSGQ